MGLYKTLRITGIKKETTGCNTFLLQPADNSELPYLPGQFLTLVFPKPGGEERRSYSFSSAPVLNESLAITVKRIENGEYSRKLIDDAQVGDELTTIGAGGFFVLPDNLRDYQQLFFIAAGSGITPVYSLLKTVLYASPHLQVVLIYSNRSKENTIFYEALRQLEIQFAGRFTIEWLFSSSYSLSRARLSKWLMEILLRTYRIAPLPQTLFYCCGPFDYMRMVTIQLLQDGVPVQNIRKEDFATIKPIIKAQPPDKNKHGVKIYTADNSYDIETQYPQTILQSAKKAGIALPYSCEAGKCGSCAATCTSGKVWMSYNEVLMDEEIEKGRVLTCVGYAIESDIILKYS